MIKFLIEVGANAELPIYDTSVHSAPTDSVSAVGNCLCEAIKLRDEPVFLQVLSSVSYSESAFDLAYGLCVELWKQEDARKLEMDASDFVADRDR
jgi:hypothetical protein